MLAAPVCPSEMRVFRGTLVHSRVPERIEVSPEHCIGFEEGEQGKVRGLRHMRRRVNNVWFVRRNCQYT